jgi:ABC-type sugar transport system permease subunit
MIQRIQSVFLFLASLAGAGQFALPYATTAPGQAVAEPALRDGVFNAMDNTGIFGLAVLSAATSLVAIFLYRNRRQQARLTAGAALATLLLVLLLSITLYQLVTRVGTTVPLYYQIGLGLPPVALALQWLAARNIRKDEALVKSMDRLR